MFRALLEMVIARSRGQRQSKHIGDRIPSDSETEAALSTVWMQELGNIDEILNFSYMQELCKVEVSINEE